MKYVITSFLVLWVAAVSAQRITIDLPHFAGKEYVWFLCNGDGQDTLSRGKLDAKGRTVLTVPAAYKGWKGMSNCLLTEGGGLDIILNGEGDFTAGCAVAAPTMNDIYYINSPENTFLIQQYIKQQKLMSKVEGISSAVWAYTPDEPLYKTLSEEKERLETAFAALQKETAESPLYAARLRQMQDYCSGIGSRLNMTETEFKEEQRRYVREALDFKYLWYSGMWKTLFANWMGLEATFGDEALMEDVSGIMSRYTKQEEIYDICLKKIVMMFHQYGKEGLLAQIGIDDVFAPGHQAPKIYLSDNTALVPLNSLVFFYESDCNNCQNELLQLRGNYSLLQEKNIRVISVSADTDEVVYRTNADLFPWQQKICDYKGFSGVNFKNYGIIGTPMIFLIDRTGTISGRYAQIHEVMNDKMLK